MSLIRIVGKPKRNRLGRFKKGTIPTIIKKQRIGGERFIVINTPEKSYWFGFLVGDGSVGIYGKNRYRLKIGLQKKDKRHLEKLAIFLGFKEPEIYTYGSICEFKVDNKMLVSNLFNLGLCQNKVHKTSKKLIPKKYKRDFIRGLFDADGTIHVFLPKNRKIKSAEFHINGTKNLLEGIKEVLAKEIDKVNMNMGCITKGKGCYVLQYKGRWLVDKIGRYLYQNAKVSLERKYKIFQELFNYNKRYSRKYRKFNRKDILKIRKLYEINDITQKEIAKKFNVSQSHISRILRRERYQNIKIIGGDICAMW